MAVRTRDTLAAELCALHGSGMTWRQIAALARFCGVPAGTLCAIAKGAPVPAKHRQRLGLPATATVEAVAGPAPPAGAQAGPWRRCIECDAVFLTNHPCRKRCFVCSPYRGKQSTE